MTHASLFSGIGGPDLAAEWMGWKNVFHCEINPFGQKILKYYWPNSISYEDIKTTDFTIHRGTIDVLTGGFPCQPYSTAGLRKGKEDERHLWPQMLRAIREIQPRWIVGENVRGLVSWNGGMVFEEVQSELEAEGYEVESFILPAAGIGAPHKRERIWFVAYSSDNNGRRQQSFKYETRQYIFSKSSGFGFQWTFANPSGIRFCWDDWNGQNVKQCREGGATCYKSYGNGREGYTSNSTSQGLSISRQTGIKQLYKEKTEGVDNRFKFNSKSNVQHSKWRDFPTQSPVCIGDDGLSSRLVGITFSKFRTESIKAGGNAIVPQVIHQIFKSIEAYENLINK